MLPIGRAWKERLAGSVLLVAIVVEIVHAIMREREEATSPGDRAVRCLQLGLVGVAQRSQDIESVLLQIAEALADAGIHAVGAAIWRPGVLGVRVALRRVLLEDEVDHAGNRVGSIHCSGTVEQDFHALHGVQWDRVDVDREPAAVRIGQCGDRRAHPVDQHQRVFGRQRMQGRRRDTGAAAVDGGGIRHEILHLGEALDQLGRVGGAALLDVGPAECQHRQGAFGDGPRDARPCDREALPILRDHVRRCRDERPRAKRLRKKQRERFPLVHNHWLAPQKYEDLNVGMPASLPG